MTNKLEVSVVIPTYKRAHLIGYVFEGLRRQTYKDFEVVVVLKPSGDGTEEVIKKFKKQLNINLILQKRGYFVDALNLGLENATGDIIAFLDDDAIPLTTWIRNHIETYTNTNIGGVAGDVIPAILKEKRPIPIDEKFSEIIPDHKPFLERIGRRVWSRPLEGLEDYLVYVSKAGVVQYNSGMSHRTRHQTTKSLLGMGANMSVLAEAIKGFKFPDSWILGLSNEQFVGWHIWKKGYNLVFNPEAKVYHIFHGQTLSREIKDIRKEVLRWVEYNLLFYRLYGLEPGLSKMHRAVWLAFSAFVDLKKLCKDRDFRKVAKLRGTLLGNLIGVKWLLCRNFGLSYTPLKDLEAIVKRE